MGHGKTALVTTFASTLVVGVLATGVSVAQVQADTSTDSVQVQVNAKAPLGVIPNTAFGLNTAVWDGALLDSAVPGLIRDSGVGMLRYPGGSTADVYHWQTNSITPGDGGTAPGDTFDNFMNVVRASGTNAMVTVNYGSNAAGTGGGDPAEAAAWVKHAKDQHDKVTYWTVGNEIYGNGYYNGSAWEVDLHKDHSPTTYADNLLTYISDMKAADPSAQIGAVLTAPGNWPDAAAIGGATTSYPDGKDPVNVAPQPWNPTVLQIAGSKIDYVDVHWYPQNPGNESDAGLLSSTSQIAGMVSTLRSEINQYCGANASHVKIMVTETNSVSYNPGRQTTSLTNALFLADNDMTWLENGVANVDWWDLHNGIVTGKGISTGDNLYGTTQYGDYGVLSAGGTGTDANGNPVSEPPVDTPMPSYYGLQMLSFFARPGDTMLPATSNQSLVTVHAVQQRGGKMAILLINKDPKNSYTLDLSTLTGTDQGHGPKHGPGAGDDIQVYTYGENSSSITTSTADANGSITLGPYSLTTVVWGPGKGKGKGK